MTRAVRGSCRDKQGECRRRHVISDGEMSKISYATYIRHRLTGFEIDEVPRATPKDLDDFPAFKRRLGTAGWNTKISSSSGAW